MRLLEHLAKKLYRNSEKAGRRGDRVELGAKTILFLLVCASTIALVLPAYENYQESWRELGPQVLIPRSDWHYVYDAEALGERGNDLFDPSNPLLWASGAARQDSDHAANLLKRKDKTFWMGITIAPSLLEQAERIGANQFYIGYLLGEFRIWVDGSLHLQGDRRVAEIITISIPMPRLHEGRPLHIAIEILNNAGHPYPDLLGGIIKEGFSTWAHVASLKAFLTFVNRALPFTFFIANLFVATIFFLFWRSFSSKKEYFYLALYSGFCAFYQLRQTDLVYKALDLNVSYSIDIFFRFIEGGLGMVLGLAYARSRPLLVFLSTIASLVIPVVINLLLVDSLEKFSFNGAVAKWLVPSSLSVGSFVCLLQAYYLFARSKKGMHLPVRMKRLISFAVGLALIAAISYVQSGGLAVPTYFVVWGRLAHFLFIAMLGLIVISDYKNQETLVRKAPVSEYHRRPVLPEKIAGCMLVADLKSSEIFYKLRAQQGGSENIVALWRSHFYTSLIKHGGFVINKKGDEIIGFFDQEKVADPVGSALRCLEEISSLSAVLEQDLRSRDLFPAGAKGFYFRAAVTLGEIRPVWEQMGDSQREAYWEEAGTTSVFVESARLLETEKRVSGRGDESLVILREAVAEELLIRQPNFNRSFVARAHMVKDKHGNVDQCLVALGAVRHRQKALVGLTCAKLHRRTDFFQRRFGSLARHS